MAPARITDDLPEPRLIVAKKSLAVKRPVSVSTSNDAHFVHPDLTITHSPTKGRSVTPKAAIRDGTLLMVSLPYVVVPALRVDEPPFSLCSLSSCNRRLHPRGDTDTVTRSRSCPDCISEVVWCSPQCQTEDSSRHALECAWLRSHAAILRQQFGDGDFGLAWLIARMLIRRWHDSQAPAESLTADPDPDPASASASASGTEIWHKTSWAAVWALEGLLDRWPAARVAQWTALARDYLTPPVLSLPLPVQETLDAEQVVELICRVETNSFGLYPGVTGEYPVESYVSRGAYYGAGVYPAASMYNHSCCPNLTHELDEHGRRRFKAGRDIEAGEECCISYFDLVEFHDAATRQAEMRRNWDFVCKCERCETEGDHEFPAFLKAFGMG